MPILLTGVKLLSIALTHACHISTSLWKFELSPQGFYSTAKNQNQNNPLPKKPKPTSGTDTGTNCLPFKKFLIYSDELVMEGTDLRLRHKNLQEWRIL